MSRSCEICSRGTVVANNVSHSNIKTKRVQKVNLKRVRILVNGESRRVRVCTSCFIKIERPAF
ncbi:50S ribosomal protein L28 [Myxococcota bacterium]|nr:50S ribosomal protein L28 [Myxococcota bacterium]MBU1379754.1 50S ribosomal protein L28 [Myxococcota bacterium]MBU1498533.1 50S ribosomal protein L28 [Myxococcota bacterium]